MQNDRGFMGEVLLYPHPVQSTHFNARFVSYKLNNSRYRNDSNNFLTNNVSYII